MITKDTTETPGNSPLIPLPLTAARALTAAGAVITIVSAFLSWTWDSDFADDLTYSGDPSGLQFLAVIAAVVTLLFALSHLQIRGLRWLNPSVATTPVFLSALATFAVVWYVVLAIAFELGGLVNLDPGGWIAAVGSAISVAGALALPGPARP